MASWKFWSRCLSCIRSRWDDAIVSLAIRTFLFAFLPVCLALVVSFAVQNLALRQTEKRHLEESLRRTEEALASADEAHSERSRRQIATLASDCQICHQLAGQSGDEAVRTGTRGLGEIRISSRGQHPTPEIMEAQLQKWLQTLQADLLVVSDRVGRPIVGVSSNEEGGVLLDSFATALQGQDENCLLCHTAPLLNVQGRLYDAITVPVPPGEEKLASLTVGWKLDARSLNPLGEAAIVSGSRMLLTNFPADRVGEIEQQLEARCGWAEHECEMEIGGETYLALRVRRSNAWGSYHLVSFHSLDAPLEEQMRDLQRTFLWIGLGSGLMALLVSAIASRWLGKPVADLIGQLRETERTGQLQTYFRTDTAAKEVNLLAEAFNRAAKSVLESQERLEQATVEFMESLARALDTRDHYTAGHSDRVSANSVTIAGAMALPPEEIEIIRIGAKLHDIGKIGISDAVLRKPGPLTEEEFALIKRHPQMGKGILEKVESFRPYLPIVELHHEDYAGSGYPYGLRGEEIPLSVRIVHLADVYDALTSERSYRKAMPEADALELIKKGSGTQFDPNVVQVVLSIHQQRKALENILQAASAIQVQEGHSLSRSPAEAWVAADQV